MLIIIEEVIAKELGVCNYSRAGWCLRVENEKDFVKIIEASFQSVNFLGIVGGLIKIAKAKKNEWQKDIL